MPKWPDLFGNTRGAKCDWIKIMFMYVSSLVVLILLVQVIPLYAGHQKLSCNQCSRFRK
jgi:hypothetical protein